MDKPRTENSSLARQVIANLVRIQDKFFVLKVSGKVISTWDEGNKAFVDNPNFDKVIEDAANLIFLGCRVVFVCGAQGQIDYEMKEIGLSVEKRDGIRITPPEAIEPIQRIYQKIRDRIQKILNKLSFNPGLVWLDEAIVAKPISSEFMRTGEVDSVEVMSFHPRNAEEPHVPKMMVIPALAKGKDSLLYNVNADVIAAEVAVTLQAEKLVFLSDKPVMDERMSTVISRLDAEGVKYMLARKNAITGGMVAKLNAVIAALKGGVKTCHISIYHPGDFLVDAFSGMGTGTTIATEL